MTRTKLPVGASALLLGLAVALAGSFSDNLLGETVVVTVLQVVLWIAGGILILAGAASVVTSRTGQRAARAAGGTTRLRPSAR